MEFSPAIYKRLLGFYEDKFEVSRGNELQGQRSNLSQAEILYQGWDFVEKILSILSDFLRQEKLRKKSWANLKNFTSRMTKLKFFQNWLAIFGVSFSGETKSERIERIFFTKSHPKLPVSGSTMTGRMIIITTGKIMNVGQIMGSRKKCWN